MELIIHPGIEITLEDIEDYNITEPPSGWLGQDDHLWAFYDWSLGLIMVCGGFDAAIVLALIAHEAYHAWQHVNGKEMTEPAADRYALTSIVSYQVGEHYR